MMAASIVGPASAAPEAGRAGLSAYEQNPLTQQTGETDGSSVVIVNVPGDDSTQDYGYGQDNPDNTSPQQEHHCTCMPVLPDEA